MDKQKLRLPLQSNNSPNAANDGLYSPGLPMQTRALRKVRRHCLRALSRKSVVALILFFIISIGVLHTTDRLPTTYAPWKLTSSPASCSTSRSNPYRIRPPKAASPEVLSSLWESLSELFDTYPPSPSHLDQPHHESDLHIPSKEKLGSFFNLSDDDAASTRNAHRQVLAKLPSYPTGKFSGRGVVILAGGRFSEYAATSLGMLRETGSQLPVEVWIKDEKEEIPGWCEELEEEGMSCRRLSDYMDPATLKHSYAMKVFTMLYSSFEEMLFIDADSAPVQYPDPIFDSELYEKNGAILWPDYWPHTGSPWLPYIIGLTDVRSDMLAAEQSVESGQIVWNKKKHWKSLLMAVYYNYFGPEYFYTLFNNGWAGWGDKDTFPMALRATYEPYFQVSHGIITIFLTDAEPQLGIGMIQSNPLNQTGPHPMFLHSNIVKWSMREFSCIGCDDQANYSSHYHLEDETSPVHKHLKEGKRIFAMGTVKESGIDPEPLMWKSIEHTACRSRAWGRPQACEQTRSYMEKAFGFRFEKSNYPSPIGIGKDYCIAESQSTTFSLTSNMVPPPR